MMARDPARRPQTAREVAADLAPFSLAEVAVSPRRALTAVQPSSAPSLLPENDARLDEFRWWLEELRVGLFAQELKTPQPVSVKRLDKIWAQAFA